MQWNARAEFGAQVCERHVPVNLFSQSVPIAFPKTAYSKASTKQKMTESPEAWRPNQHSLHGATTRAPGGEKVGLTRHFMGSHDKGNPRTSHSRAHSKAEKPGESITH